MSFYLVCEECESDVITGVTNADLITQQMLDDHDKVCDAQQEDDDDQTGEDGE